MQFLKTLPYSENLTWNQLRNPYESQLPQSWRTKVAKTKDLSLFMFTRS